MYAGLGERICGVVYVVEMGNIENIFKSGNYLPHSTYKGFHIDLIADYAWDIYVIYVKTSICAMW